MFSIPPLPPPLPQSSLVDLAPARLEISCVHALSSSQSHDNEDETKDKLAAELVAKTNDLQNLMLEHSQLQKIARFA